MRELGGEAQLLQPAVHGACRERGLGGVEVGPHRGRTGRQPGLGGGRRVGQCPAHLRGHAEPELPPVELAAFVGLLPRPPVVTQGEQGLDQHGVAVGVEGVQVQRAGGEVDGVVRPSGRQRGERCLVEQRQDAVLEPVPLVLQPGLECRAVFEGETLQEVAVEGAGVGAAGWLQGRQHIAVPAGRQHQPQRVAADRIRAEGPAQLGEVPAQGAERVLGVGEQEGRRPGPAGAARLQREVGQHSPRLAAPGLPGCGASGLDPGRTEEPNPSLGHMSHATPRVGGGARNLGMGQRRRPAGVGGRAPPSML